MPRPERTFHSDAIIMRRHDFGEADRLLTIFTPEHGKLKAIAKGSKKPAGRRTGHVELYTRVAMMIGYGRELHVVTQAELRREAIAAVLHARGDIGHLLVVCSLRTFDD